MTIRHLIILFPLLLTISCFGTNKLWLFNEDSTGNRTAKTEIQFADKQELSIALQNIPDTFNAVVLHIDSVLDLPDNFFNLTQIQFMQIVAPVIKSIDSRFSNLKNLYWVEIICETMEYLTPELAELKELQALQIDAKTHVDKSIKPTLTTIINQTKSDYLAVALNYWTLDTDKIESK